MGCGGSSASGTSTGGTFKLTYFNVKGRGELSRLLMAAAGVKFEDHRIEQKDWPSMKKSK